MDKVESRKAVVTGASKGPGIAKSVSYWTSN